MEIKKLLKTTSLAILLMATSTFSLIQPVSAKSSSNDNICKVKDLTTGIESTVNIPKFTHTDEDLVVSTTTSSAAKISSKITIDAVFDPDDRTVVSDTTQAPYSAVCLILTTFPNEERMWGTAFMVDTQVAVTCAHTLYDATKGGMATSVSIWPQRNGDTMPKGSFSSTKVYVPNNYISDSNVGSPYDYGVILLNSTVSNKTKDQLGYTPGDKYLANNSEITLAGYPYPDSNSCKMYEASGYATSHDSSFINYEIDMEHGQSGSPLIVKYVNNSGKVYYKAIGINSTEYKDSSGNPTTNTAVRITTALEDIIDEAMNAE